MTFSSRVPMTSQVKAIYFGISPPPFRRRKLSSCSSPPVGRIAI